MNFGRFRPSPFLLALVVFGNLAASAMAQTFPDAGGSEEAVPAEVTLPDPLTPEAIRELVSALSDNQVRALLLERLDAVAETGPIDDRSTLEKVRDLAAEASEKTAATIGSNFADLGGFLTAQGNVLARFFDALGAERLELLLLAIFTALLVAVGVELLAYRLIFGGRAPEAPPPNEDIIRRLRRAIKRLANEIIGATIFATVAYSVLLMFKPEDAMPVVEDMLYWIVLMPRFGMALARFFFVSGAGATRLLTVEARQARILFLCFVGLTYFFGISLSLNAINQTFGGPPDAQPFAFWFWFNVIFFGWLALTFAANADAWRSIMRGGRSELSPFEAWSIRVYPWVAVVIILLTWLLCVAVLVMGAGEVLAGGRHIISMAIILVAPLLDTFIHAIVNHILRSKRGDGEAADRAYQASNSALVRIGRVLVFGFVVLVSSWLWNVSPTGMAMSSAGVGEQLADTLLIIGMIAIGGYLAWEATRLAFNIRLASENTSLARQVPSGEGEGGDEPTSRLGTILPPISKSAQVLILTVTTLTILSQLGVDVTALLAGAGIIGIAIGFGSQKLVSDVMSGMFFLFDDAFRLNEFIDVGGQVGTVERISLRSIQLRDSKGPVLIIPYSEIKSVTNFGRDWGIMKLRFTVPFDTDVEQVRKIFKKIGQEMLQDPELGPGFIEPFKSQGVAEFNDYGIVLRGKFTHKPGKQFEIRKRAFTRIKEEFDKAGIQFARREVKVNLGDSRENLSEAQLKLVAAAASESVAQVDREKITEAALEKRP
jgi:moderate conductance mechanosensitive channel